MSFKLLLLVVSQRQNMNAKIENTTKNTNKSKNRVGIIFFKIDFVSLKNRNSLVRTKLLFESS